MRSISSHGMSIQHICPNSNSNLISNGPREIGLNDNGYPNKLLGNAEGKNQIKDKEQQVLSQKEISFVDFSRVSKYNYPIPAIRL